MYGEPRYTVDAIKRVLEHHLGYDPAEQLEGSGTITWQKFHQDGCTIAALQVEEGARSVPEGRLRTLWRHVSQHEDVKVDGFIRMILDEGGLDTDP